MMQRTRKGLIAVVGLTMIGGAAMAAGNYLTYPIIGATSFCASTVTGAGSPFSGATGQGQGTTGSICAQTIPSGPNALTGTELVPLDYSAGGGGPVQTVTAPVGILGYHVNRLVGGDFATNLWQRGTTPVSAASPTTAVMAADRWFAFSASTQVTVSKQTAAGDSIAASGLYASMRVARPGSQTGTGAVNVGQVLDKVAAAPFLGNNAVCSFWALAGANFSPTNSNISVTVAYFTAADAASAQSAVGAAGTNTLSFATGTTTNYTAAVGGVSPGTTGTVSAGVATIPISTTWTRYSVYAAIPTATAAGTAVTGLGFQVGFTPVGTAGTNDWVELEGVQCQALPSLATGSLPSGVISPTNFERRPPATEAALQLAYSQIVSEVASSSAHAHAVGGSTTTGNARVYLQFAGLMRQAPALQYTAGFAGTGAGGTAQTCSALATVANTITTGSVTVDCTSTGNFTANQPSLLIDNTGAGIISASSEP